MRPSAARPDPRTRKKDRLVGALAALALTTGVGVTVAPQASAATCLLNTQVLYCGSVVVSPNSQRALTSYKNWTVSLGGHGYNGAIVRPGHSSTEFHRDSDGIQFDGRCKWRLY